VHSEEEIVEGCKKGKASFQEKLYQLYSRRMMAVCMRYTKSRFEAEDIFQEAFVKVFKNMEAYNGGSFEGWVRRIFVNTAINHYHKNRRYTEQADYRDIEESHPGEEDILSKINSSQLMVLINTLPEGYRMVFNLYVVEGFTHREIGEMLNISEGTSKSQLSKAKSQLRSILEKFSISEKC
jgi:RNA polymerase sigma-70 factor (ECF subfamily)